MTGFLASTTVQKARTFLGGLGATMPGAEPPERVLAALVERVRERRDDPAVRGLLRDLIASLDGDPARLPSPECESRDAQALARELEALLGTDGDAARRGGAWGSRAASAALLLALATLPAACGEDDPLCASDLSSLHFQALVSRSGDAPSQEDVDCYSSLRESEQREVIEDLCAMTAEEIADYMDRRFGADGDLDCATYPQPAYKGVAL